MTMSEINWASVNAKLAAWERSNKGQRKLQQTVKNYAYRNKEVTDAGSRLLTMNKIRELANILVAKVTRHASGLPSSIAQDVSTLQCGRVSRTANGFSVELNFTDDLSRQSLVPSRYGGISNIIALFNNGYPEDGGRVDAISHVEGYWHGEYIHARGEREGLHFLQAAVDEFNAEYGAQYDLTVQLDAQYK